MKKKLIIIIISILVLILLLVGLYFYGLTSVSKESEIVKFTIQKGASTKEVINNLYDAKIIKSKIATTIYSLMHRDLIIQAGEYEIDKSFDTKEIFYRFNKGILYADEIKITFIEGKRLTDYVKQVSEKFGYTEQEIMTVLSDKEYLKSIVDTYDFVSEDILNSQLYYPLEGYIFPATYSFSKQTPIENIFLKGIAKTGEVLEKYQEIIKSSGFTNHEILTMASIIENETMKSEDRSIASQVIHKRLAIKMNLGMDVTTYYGAKKALGEVLTDVDLNAQNAYNTRNSSFIGLPVGPISSPSEESIKAALYPSDTDYLYFYADVNGKLHFAKTYQEFQGLIEEYGW